MSSLNNLFELPLNVLIVDNEEFMIDLLQTCFETSQFRISVATSVKKALAVLDEMGNNIHVVITDFNLDDGTGDRIVTKMRSLSLTKLIIVISGRPHDVKKAIIFNQNTILIGKPFSFQTLLNQMIYYYQA